MPFEVFHRRLKGGHLHWASGRISLGVRYFFGEIAVLRRARRSATATARANLPVLDTSNFHLLMTARPASMLAITAS